LESVGCYRKTNQNAKNEGMGSYSCNSSDIRNDQEDNSTRAFRKEAYRQLILARHGHLGKGNRRVCPSCIVLKVGKPYPSITGVYMGYREHLL
jgi:P2X purinoceptor 7